jgi:SAM-dependent methyltransferase
MARTVSPRIARFVDRLPLGPGLHVLEVGCGPGVAARAVAARIGDGRVVAIDRSARAIALAMTGSAAEIATGRLSFRHVAVEDFVLTAEDRPFDIAFAIRVGALDGRYPDLGGRALMRLRAALRPGGLLFVDDAEPVPRDRIARDQ